MCNCMCIYTRTADTMCHDISRSCLTKEEKVIVIGIQYLRKILRPH